MREASPGMQPSPDPVACIVNPASRKFIQRREGVLKESGREHRLLEGVTNRQVTPKAVGSFEILRQVLYFKAQAQGSYRTLSRSRASRP